MCVASVSAASASEEVSGSESLDASASEADTKLHEQSEMTKSPAKLAPAHRRRPLLPATRISSRQQKRRAAAAAAAAVDSTGSGNEEEHSGSEALPLVAEREDANEKNENARDVEQEGEQPTPKMKKVAPKTRSRRKRWRKR